MWVSYSDTDAGDGVILLSLKDGRRGTVALDEHRTSNTGMQRVTFKGSGPLE